MLLTRHWPSGIYTLIALIPMRGIPMRGIPMRGSSVYDISGVDAGYIRGFYGRSNKVLCLPSVDVGRLHSSLDLRGLQLSRRGIHYFIV